MYESIVHMPARKYQSRYIHKADKYLGIRAREMALSHENFKPSI